MRRDKKGKRVRTPILWPGQQRILKFLRKGPGPYRIDEIADACYLETSSVITYLQDLKRLKLVRIKLDQYGGWLISLV